MSVRELVVLGTASQAPTRERNHNGYLLRWDHEAILFDPGEGTQRQLLLAGASAAQITRICITHAHGDHCLGLPGVLQRMRLDGAAGEVPVYHPASAAAVIDALLAVAGEGHGAAPQVAPGLEGLLAASGGFRLSARPLEHRIDAVGYRIVEPDGRRMLPDRLEAAGVRGPDVGRLIHEGWLDVTGRTVTVEEVSEPRPGQRFAFVMDTRLCDAAVALAAGADLVVCEATFLSEHADLAWRYGHLTAAQAATVARDAGARRLVLTHFSQRYPDVAERAAAEAAAVFGDVVVAHDLMRVKVPARR